MKHGRGHLEQGASRNWLGAFSISSSSWHCFTASPGIPLPPFPPPAALSPAPCLPTLPSTLLNKRFPNLSPLPSMFFLAGSSCATLRRSLLRTCLHPFAEKPPRTVCTLSSQRQICSQARRQGDRIKTPLSPRLPPAPAAAGFGFGARDDGSISPPPEQTTLLSKLVVLPFLSPRQAPLANKPRKGDSTLPMGFASACREEGRCFAEAQCPTLLPAHGEFTPVSSHHPVPALRNGAPVQPLAPTAPAATAQPPTVRLPLALHR